MKARAIALIFGVLLLACPGCKDDDGVALPPVQNNELSSVWDGRYEGGATFYNEMGESTDVRLTLTLQDIGENYVRVQAGLFPRQIYYNPPMRHDAKCTSLSRAWLDETIEGTRYIANFKKVGGGITGTMSVVGTGNAVTWRIIGINVTRKAE